MVERATDLEERLEALQDDVSLLKNEVKQTLVDLREFIMKDRTIFPQILQGPQQAVPPMAQATDRAREEQPLAAPPFPGYAVPTVPAVRRPGRPSGTSRVRPIAAARWMRLC